MIFFASKPLVASLLVVSLCRCFFAQTKFGTTKKIDFCFSPPTWISPLAYSSDLFPFYLSVFADRNAHLIEPTLAN